MGPARSRAGNRHHPHGLQELESQARRLRASTRGGSPQCGVASAVTAEEPVAPKVRKKRKLSADARRRIAEAQKRRWAKARAGKAGKE